MKKSSSILLHGPRRANIALMLLNTLLLAACSHGTSSAPASDQAPGHFSQADSTTLSQAPQSGYTIVALSPQGENSNIAKVMRSQGAHVSLASEKSGLLIARMSGASAQQFEALNEALGDGHAATHLAISKVRKYDFSRERINPLNGDPNNQTNVILTPSATNAALPTSQTGVLDFEAQMASQYGIQVNGDSVKVAILDTGIDLAHTDVFQNRIKLAYDVTAEGRIKTAPVKAATLANGKSAVALNVGGKSVQAEISAALVSPSGEYFAGTWSEANYGTEAKDGLGADIDQDGKRDGVFNVLLSNTASGWKVAIDVNRDGSFADELPVSDYKVNQETIAADHARAGSVRVSVNLTFDASGALVKNDDGTVDVDLGGYDSGQHGTHVAGIIGGRFEGQAFGGNYRGAAPAAQIYSFKVLGKNGGEDADILRGLSLAVENGAKVINMSLGGSAFPSDGSDNESKMIDQITRRNGVLVVVAAGNDGPSINSVGTPGTAKLALTIGAYITASTYAADYGVTTTAMPAHSMFFFSSMGPEDNGDVRPNIVAPGAAYSSIPLARQIGADVANSGYEVMQGTSMATPASTGAIVELLDAINKLKGKVSLPNDPISIKWALMEGAKNLNDLNKNDATAPRYQRFEQGAGLLNIPAAFDVLTKRVNEPSTEYDVATQNLRPSYSGGAVGIYSEERLPDEFPMQVRKRPGDPVNPADVNFNRTIKLSSDVSWVTPEESTITLNGVNVTETMIKTNQDELAKLPSGVNSAVITGRRADNDQIEFIMNVSFVNARQLTHAFDQDAFLDRSLHLQAGGYQRYFFYVEPGRTRLETSISVPQFGANGKPTRGGYTFFVSDPTGNRVFDSFTALTRPYASGTNPTITYAKLAPINGVWEVDVYRSDSSITDDGAIFRFSEQTLIVTPAVWDVAGLAAGVTAAKQTFTLKNYSRSVTPVTDTSISQIGTVLKDVSVGQDEKKEIPLLLPASVHDITVRTRFVQGIPSADIDVFILDADGNPIASAKNGPTADETAHLDLPNGVPAKGIKIQVIGSDMKGHKSGLTDVEVSFSLPFEIKGVNQIDSPSLDEGKSAQLTSAISFGFLPADLIADIKKINPVVRLTGSLTIYDTNMLENNKASVVPITIAIP